MDTVSPSQSTPHHGVLGSPGHGGERADFLRHSDDSAPPWPTEAAANHKCNE